jgi:hypothetical protein
LLADSRHKSVGSDEDECVGSCDSFDEIGHGDDSLRDLDSGEVFRVLVKLVKLSRKRSVVVL